MHCALADVSPPQVGAMHCAPTSYPAKYPSLPREEKRGFRKLVAGGQRPLATDINTGGGNAPITVVRPRDVNRGANLNGVYGDSLPSLGVVGLARRVDHDRTTTRRCSHDRIAMHARHRHRLALALCPLHSQRLGVSSGKGGSLSNAVRRTQEHAGTQGEREGEDQDPNQEAPAPAPSRSRWLIQQGRDYPFVVF